MADAQKRNSEEKAKTKKAKRIVVFIVLFALVFAAVGSYFIFKEQEYTIEFDSAGGQSIQKINFTNSKSLTLPDEVIKVGHTFNGWTVAADSSKFITSTSQLKGSVRLIASWTKNKYNVNLNIAGKKLSSISVDFPATIDITSTNPPGLWNWIYNPPANAPYTFAGWRYIDTDGKEKELRYSYTDTDTIVWTKIDGSNEVELSSANLLTLPLYNVNLHAILEYDQVKIVFKDLNGTVIKDSDIVDYGDKIVAPSYNDAAQFMGWQLVVDGVVDTGTDIGSEQRVGQLLQKIYRAGDEIEIDSVLSYLSAYTQDSYAEIYFKAVTWTNDQYYIEETTEDGYHYNVLTNKSQPVQYNGNTILLFVPEPSVRGAMYFSNYEYYNKDNEKITIAASSISAGGYAVSVSDLHPSHATVFTQTWDSNTVTIDFNYKAKLISDMLLGEYVPAVYQMTALEVGQKIVLPSASLFASANKEFIGWREYEGGRIYPAGSNYYVSGIYGRTYTLVGVWYSNSNSFVFDTAGGNDFTLQGNEMKGEVGKKTTVLERVPVRFGYVFDCWTTADGTEYRPGDEIEITDERVILTARWIAKNVEVRLSYKYFDTASGTYKDASSYSISTAFGSWITLRDIDDSRYLAHNALTGWLFQDVTGATSGKVYGKTDRVQINESIIANSGYIETVDEYGVVTMTVTVLSQDAFTPFTTSIYTNSSSAAVQTYIWPHGENLELRYDDYVNFINPDYLLTHDFWGFYALPTADAAGFTFSYDSIDGGLAPKGNGYRLSPFMNGTTNLIMPKQNMNLYFLMMPKQISIQFNIDGIDTITSFYGDTNDSKIDLLSLDLFSNGKNVPSDWTDDDGNNYTFVAWQIDYFVAEQSEPFKTDYVYPDLLTSDSSSRRIKTSRVDASGNAVSVITLTPVWLDTNKFVVKITDTAAYTNDSYDFLYLLDQTDGITLKSILADENLAPLVNAAKNSGKEIVGFVTYTSDGTVEFIFDDFNKNIKFGEITENIIGDNDVEKSLSFDVSLGIIELFPIYDNITYKINISDGKEVIYTLTGDYNIEGTAVALPTLTAADNKRNAGYHFDTAAGAKIFAQTPNGTGAFAMGGSYYIGTDNNEIDFRGEFNQNNEITLYIVWLPNRVTIKYINDSQEFTQSSNYGSKIKLRSANTFTKVGYQFGGWSTVNGTGGVTFDSSHLSNIILGGEGVGDLNNTSLNILNVSAADFNEATFTYTIRLYPIWKATSANITFNLNDSDASYIGEIHNFGEGQISEYLDILYGSKIQVDTDKANFSYAQNLKTFVGWYYKDAQGTEVPLPLDANGIFDYVGFVNALGYAANLEVYAKWSNVDFPLFSLDISYGTLESLSPIYPQDAPGLFGTDGEINKWTTEQVATWKTGIEFDVYETFIYAEDEDGNVIRDNKFIRRGYELVGFTINNIKYKQGSENYSKTDFIVPVPTAVIMTAVWEVREIIIEIDVMASSIGLANNDISWTWSNSDPSLTYEPENNKYTITKKFGEPFALPMLTTPSTSPNYMESWTYSIDGALREVAYSGFENFIINPDIFPTSGKLTFTPTFWATATTANIDYHAVFADGQTETVLSNSGTQIKHYLKPMFVNGEFIMSETNPAKYAANYTLLCETDFSNAIGTADPDTRKDKGMKYTGMYAAATGGATNKYNSVINFTAEKDGAVKTIDVYLIYTYVSGQVVLNYNGGELVGGTSIINTHYGSTVTLPNAKYPGYVLDYWCKNSDGSGEKYYANITDSTAAGAYIYDNPNNSKDGGTVTLYAKWKEEIITINFYVDGSLKSGGLYDNGAAYSNQFFANKTYADSLSKGAQFPEPAKTGYTFIGWSTAQDLATSNGTAATLICFFDRSSGSLEIKTYGHRADIESFPLYARFVPNDYTATLNISYDVSAENGTALKKDTYTITFGTAFNFEVPTRPGYTFGGWYSAEGGKGTRFADDEGKGLFNWTTASDKTLYAYWIGIEYTITLVGEGGTPANMTAPVICGSVYNLPVPTRTGYDFGGWWSAQNGIGTQYTDSDGASFATWTMIGGTTMYAYWTLHTYTITLNFDYDNISMTAYATYLTAYSFIDTNTGLAPVRPGYTFKGWFANANGLGTQFTDANGDSIVNWTGTADRTVYAYWIANTYSVIYSTADGSTITPATTTVVYASTYTFQIPTRVGYKFDGWFAEIGGTGRQYTAANGVSLSTWDETTETQFTIYAKWIGNTLTIYYDGGTADGGTAPISPVSALYGENVTMPICTYTKIGYGFNGWQVGGINFKSGTYAAGDIIAVSDLSSGIASGNAFIYLIATFKEKQIEIIYNFDGGECVPAVSSKYVDYNSTTALDVPTKTGYTFGGWWSLPNGAGTQFTSASGYLIAAKWEITDATLNVWAKWSTNEITVFYNNDGGVSASSKTIEYNSSTALDIPTKTGYTFGGWWTAQNSNGTNNGIQYTDETGALVYGGGIWKELNNITLWAKWTANDITIYYVVDGGNLTETSITVKFDSSTALDIPTKTGYVFGGWWSSSNGQGIQYTNAFGILTAGYPTWNITSAAVSVYAKWTANTLSINYASGGSTSGNSPISPLSGAYDSVVTMPVNTWTKTGWTFTGWHVSGTDAIENTYTSGTQVSVSDLSNAIANGNAAITLTATWRANVLTINYVSTNHTSGTVPAQEVQAYVDMITIAGQGSLIRTGYTFGGWTVSGDTGSATETIHQPGTYIMTQVTTAIETGDAKITLTAIWTINTLLITYNGGDNTSGSAPTTPTSVDYNATLTLQANTYVRIGYTFAGWAVSGDIGYLAGTYAAGTAKTAQAWSTAVETAHNKNLILTATWTINTLLITYDGGDNTSGNAPTTPTSVDYNIILTLPANTYARTGYTFAGWAVSGDTGYFGGTYAAGTAKLAQEWTTAINTAHNKNLILTATWTINTLLVTYNGGDNTSGSAPILPTSVDYNATLTLPTNTYARTGYTFAGWAVSGDTGYFGGTYAAGTAKLAQEWTTAINTAHNKNLTLTATWTINTLLITYNGGGNTSGSVPVQNTQSYNSLIIADQGSLIKTGYTFGGWIATGSIGTKTGPHQPDTYTMTEITTAIETGDAVITLTAVWNVNSYVVKYDLGASGVLDAETNGYLPESKVVTYDSTYKLNIPKRDQFIFVGWFEGVDADGNGTGIQFTSYDGISIGVWRIPADSTAYAVWTQNIFYLTLDVDGGETVTSASHRVTLDSYFTLPVTTKTGHTFGGWYSEKNGTGIQYTTDNGASISPWRDTSDLTLYANWILNSLTIQYVSFDHTSGTVPSQQTQYYNSLTIAGPGTLQRLGFTFIGWQVFTANLTGPYLPGQYTMTSVIPEIASRSTSALFIAYWESNDIVITYQKDGGNMTPVSKTVQYNSSMELDVPTKVGYTFGGWWSVQNSNGTSNGIQYTEADGSLVVNAGTDISNWVWRNTSGTITLWAKWTINTLLITYNGGGNTSGSAPTTPISVDYNVTLTLPANTYVRTGYSFAGWAVTGDTGYLAGTYATGTAKTAQAWSTAIETAHNKNLTLTATWTINTLLVTYNGGGNTSGSAPTTPTSVDYNATLTLPANTYVRTGYTFAGWAISGDTGNIGGTYAASTAKLAQEWTTAINTAHNKNLTLSATWTINTLLVTYNGGGNTSGSAPTTPTSVDYNATLTLPSNTYVRTGYTFAGWAVSGDTGYLAGTYATGTAKTAQAWSTAVETAHNKNLTLTATWTINTLLVTYNGGGNTSGSAPTTPTSVDYNATLTLPTNTYVRTGYTFAGWAVSGDAGNIGGTYATGTAKTAQAWSTAVETAHNKNLTLTATWTINTLLVTYNGGTGGTGSAPTTPTSVDYNATLTLPANTYVRTGYTFAGWAVSGDTGNIGGTHATGTAKLAQAWSTAVETAHNKNLTLTATWTINTLLVTYSGGTGGTGSAPTTPTSVNYNATLTLPANTYTRTGYSFAGWAISGDTGNIGGTYAASTAKLAQEWTTAINTAHNKNLTLTATWSANDIVVTYQKDGGTLTDNSKTVKYDSTTGLAGSSNITRTGYTFGGWWSAQNSYGTSNGTQYTDANGALVTTAGTDITGGAWKIANANPGTITLWAKWSPINIVVTYQKDGGTLAATNKTVLYDSTTALDGSTAITKTGYTFGGWWTSQNSDGTSNGTQYTSADGTLTKSPWQESSGAITLWAKWTRNTLTISYNAGTGGSGTAPTSPTSATYNNSITFPVNTFTRTGYSFAGWDVSGSGAITQTWTSGSKVVSDLSSLTSGIGLGNATVILTATWTINTLLVTYSGGTGGTGSAPTTPTSVNYNATLTLPANTYTRTGYSFAGWAISGDTGNIGGTYAASTAKLAQEWTTAINTAHNKNLTLTATWSSNDIVVTYQKDGGTLTDNNKTVKYDSTTGLAGSSNITRTGYTFGGWWSAQNSYGTSNGTQYTDANGALVTTAGTDITGGAWKIANANPGTITLWAKWTAINIVVTYQKDGGTLAATNKTVLYDSTTALDGSTAITKTGYTFGGWWTSQNSDGTSNGTQYTSADGTLTKSPWQESSGAITLWAKWTRNTLTISYNAGTGGTGTAPTSPTSATYNNNVTMPTCTYTRTGFVFNGWAVSGTNSVSGTWAAGAVKTVSELSTGINSGNASITLTATWVERMIRFFDAAGNEVTFSNLEVWTSTTTKRAATEADYITPNTQFILPALAGTGTDNRNYATINSERYQFVGWVQGTAASSGDGLKWNGTATNRSGQLLPTGSLTDTSARYQVASAVTTKTYFYALYDLATTNISYVANGNNYTAKATGKANGGATSIPYAAYDSSTGYMRKVISIESHGFSYMTSTLAKVYIGAGVETIGTSAFEKSGMTSLAFGHWWTSGAANLIINDFAFAYNINLTAADIPLATTVIGPKAFIECFKITRINLDVSRGGADTNARLTTIGASAFESCTVLTSLFPIPLTVGTNGIGVNAFIMTGLTSFSVASGHTIWKSGTYGDLCKIVGSDTHLIVYAPGKTATEVTATQLSGITFIAEYAFAFHNKIEVVTIPSGIKLGKAVFAFSPYLKTVNISSANPTDLQDSATAATSAFLNIAPCAIKVSNLSTWQAHSAYAAVKAYFVSA